MEIPTHPEEFVPYKDPAEYTNKDGTIKLKKAVIGTNFAHFTNTFNPLFDGPFERPGLNGRQNPCGYVIDPELSRLIQQELVSEKMQRHRKRKDWMKVYMDDCVKFSSITKGKLGASSKK